MTTAIKETNQLLSAEVLSETLHDGDMLYTQITRSSRSGMRRWVRVFFAAQRGGRIFDMTYSIGCVLGRNLHRRDAWEIVLPGCTPDNDCDEMIADLSRALGISLRRERL